MKNFDFTWIITILSLTGSYFNIKKKIICFYLWAASVVIAAIFDFFHKQYGRVFLDIFMLCIDIYGVISWSKSNRKNTKKGG